MVDPSRELLLKTQGRLSLPKRTPGTGPVFRPGVGWGCSTVQYWWLSGVCVCVCARARVCVCVCVCVSAFRLRVGHRHVWNQCDGSVTWSQRLSQCATTAGPNGRQPVTAVLALAPPHSRRKSVVWHGGTSDQHITRNANGSSVACPIVSPCSLFLSKTTKPSKQR